MKSIFTLSMAFLLALSLSQVEAQESLIAKFSAKETEKEIYKQGFDSTDELEGWTFSVTNTSKTWKLANSTSIDNFSKIDESSVYSLYIEYDSSIAQKEEAKSPIFDITASSELHFYSAFDGVFSLYAPLYVEVEDQESLERKTIFNSFLWSQDNGHERPKWLKFNFKLKEFEGKKVRIIFKYEGVDGDDALIDGFRITEKDDSEDATVTINEGGVVNFQDISKGNPTTWEWIFEGGVPSTSTEQNPVVTYNESGTYNVVLKVGNGTTFDEVTRTDFVKVQGVAPVAAFDFPAEGYFSPNAAVFVPLNVPVTYTDKSKNVPSEWSWILGGTEKGTYDTQNPTVIYTEEGLHDAVLTVKNKQGSDILDYVKAVKAGGTSNIWNIAMDESSTIDAVDLSWYGYYGGSNWLDMYAFAERYKAPLAEATIDEVDIYFAYTETVLEPVDIKVYLTTDKDGLPGDTLATSILSTADLAYNSSTWVPTTFKFSEPITIEEPFFIVVDGFPNREDDKYNTDKVVIGAVRRDSKSTKESTVYHYGPDSFSESTESVWLRNVDDNLSFGIAPKLTYKLADTGVGQDKQDLDAPFVFVNNGQITVSNIEGSYSVEVYNVAGALLSSYNNSSNETISTAYTNGVYIVRIIKGNSTWSYKVAL